MATADTKQIPDLRGHLLEAILPFWERFSVDRDYGGFITQLARDGSVTNASEKFLVMQARMIYSFTAGAKLGGPANWLGLADQGVAFLMAHFRDRVYDGWFWSTSRQGQPMQVVKNTSGHASVACALAEYSRISHSNHALASAVHTWSLISDHLWDAHHGGAFEACDRGWRPLDRGHTIGTHLRLLEALISLHKAVGGNRYWPAVRSTCDLVVDRMIDHDYGCALERFRGDWTVSAAVGASTVNYGHNLEAAWLLLRTHRLETAPGYAEVAHRLLDYVLRSGLDNIHGGVFYQGSASGPAVETAKIWWVQTEAIVAFLLGYLEFGDSRYWEAFLNVSDFCLRQLYDPEHGEWFAATSQDGAPRQTAKGSEWKAAYHVTQACVYADRYLAEIRAAQR